MKRRLYLILLFIAVTFCATAQNVGDAFYVYRNDGKVNVFMRNQIEKMEYSNEDENGNAYDEIVTQLVFTPDSVYYIPIASIDSVGFVTPENKYRPEVRQIEGELRSYVISQDDHTILFSSGIPVNIMPKIGDKLVTLEMSDVFPIGFAGEVTSVTTKSNGVEVVCAPVALEDVFEYYYGGSEIEWDGQNMAPQTIGNTQNRRAPFSPGRINFSLFDNYDFTNSYQKNDELSFDLSELKANVAVTPTLNGIGYVVVNPTYGVNVSLTVTGEYDLEENFSLKGGLTWKKDITLPAPYDRFFWPIAPLVDVYLKLGVFVQAQGEFAVNQQWTQKYRSAFHWEYSSKGEEMLKPVNRVIPVSSGHSGEAMLSGSIGAGVFLEVGFDFIHTKKADLANVNLRGEFGANLQGDLVLTKTDMETAKTSTAIYESLRDTKLSLNWFYGVTANAQFWKWSTSHDVNLGSIKLNNQGEIISYALAPTFSNVSATRQESASTNVDAKATISGRSLKVDAGFMLKDKDGEDVSGVYVLTGYSGSQQQLTYTFQNVNTAEDYRVYPALKWMGCYVLASPYAEVEKKGETTCPDANHPHMIDLGLPSGTKWACCNVGASTPEGYGNYYAWGETQPKSWYSEDSYQYYNGNLDYPDCWINIGSDIAGTQYDAATANWGSPWRMPTLTQIEELLNNCTSVWTTQNGVNGRKFTGPNGGTIFLPAAGDRWSDELYGLGSLGDYWFSALRESYPDGACYLVFASDGAVWSYYGRLYGLSVRPVR